jgi:SpoVK/Ycf46/Vps4 family AAA+-type ATPase
MANETQTSKQSGVKVLLEKLRKFKKASKYSKEYGVWVCESSNVCRSFLITPDLSAIAYVAEVISHGLEKVKKSLFVYDGSNTLELIPETTTCEYDCRGYINNIGFFEPLTFTREGDHYKLETFRRGFGDLAFINRRRIKEADEQGRTWIINLETKVASLVSEEVPPSLETISGKLTKAEEVMSEKVRRFEQERCFGSLNERVQDYLFDFQDKEFILEASDLPLRYLFKLAANAPDRFKLYRFQQHDYDNSRDRRINTQVFEINPADGSVKLITEFWEFSGREPKSLNINSKGNITILKYGHFGSGFEHEILSGIDIL